MRKNETTKKTLKKVTFVFTTKDGTIEEEMITPSANFRLNDIPKIFEELTGISSTEMVDFKIKSVENVVYKFDVIDLINIAKKGDENKNEKCNCKKC